MSLPVNCALSLFAVVILPSALSGELQYHAFVAARLFLAPSLLPVDPVIWNSLPVPEYISSYLRNASARHNQFRRDLKTFLFAQLFNLGLCFACLFVLFDLFVSLFFCVSLGSWVISLTVLGASVTNLNEPPRALAVSTITWVRS